MQGVRVNRIHAVSLDDVCASPVGEDRVASIWLKDIAATEESVPPLPARADVVVIGGGYTGVAAALALAAAGASVTVLDREAMGFGASTRNGGFVLPGFKREYSALRRAWGQDAARRLFLESLESIVSLESLIAAESVDCDFRRVGHITLAETAGQLRSLDTERTLLAGSAGHATHLLESSDLGQEIGSPRYLGGLLDPAAGSLHPARLFAGLLRAAVRRGAVALARTEATRIEGTPGKFVVHTSRGPIPGAHVLVATNGYSGPVHRGFRRRVVPVGSHIIATAPLAPELARDLIPRQRVLSDSRHLLHYFRMSYDGRLIFGGRASFRTAGGESDPVAAAVLREDMVSVFPQLHGCPVERTWSGNVAFTRDRMPHLGRLDGVYAAGGYCGHGVAMAIYLGTRAGEHLARGAALPFLSTLSFPAVPLYTGRPWFLPLAGAWYRLLDWTARR